LVNLQSVGSQLYITYTCNSKLTKNTAILKSNSVVEMTIVPSSLMFCIQLLHCCFQLSQVTFQSCKVICRISFLLPCMSV